MAQWFERSIKYKTTSFAPAHIFSLKRKSDIIDWRSAKLQYLIEIQQEFHSNFPFCPRRSVGSKFKLIWKVFNECERIVSRFNWILNLAVTFKKFFQSPYSVFRDVDLERKTFDKLKGSFLFSISYTSHLLISSWARKKLRNQTAWFDLFNHSIIDKSSIYINRELHLTEFIRNKTFFVD